MTRHQDGKTSTSPQQHRLLGEDWGKLSLCFSSAGNGEDRPESGDFSDNINFLRAQQARWQCG
ncbi:MAG: hypothetical protein KBF91_01515 [Alphaproteobacteria bacterium]|nr:hypothetical protein [Alphaproteobacteria bacterium]